MKKIILTLSVLAILASGCKKKNDDPAPATTPTTNTITTPPNTVTPTPTNSQKTILLTQNTWNFTAASADKAVDIDGDGNSSTDVYIQEKICQQDVQIVFATDKTGYVTGDCGGKQSVSSKINFTWAFNADESAVLISAAGNTTTSQIVQLDATTLRLSTTTTDYNKLSYVETDTYMKQ